MRTGSYGNVVQSDSHPLTPKASVDTTFSRKRTQNIFGRSMMVARSRVFCFFLTFLHWIDHGIAFVPQPPPRAAILGHLYSRLPAMRSTTRSRLHVKNRLRSEDIQETPGLRFDRTATSTQSIDQTCIVLIDGKRYNMTAWAKAHPGGSNILVKFHNKDATKAFHASGHSRGAVDMLEQFLIDDDDTSLTDNAMSKTASSSPKNRLARARAKLFTKEDPIGIHKYAGLFALVHFAVRYLQTWFGDPSAGFGTRQGLGSSGWSLLCLIPHTLLSLSSLLFHTVPRERIVGRPMIWQEFRAHNIVFGMRSILTTLLAWTAIRFPQFRKVATVGSCATVLATMHLADVATAKLRDNSMESTTATMPYWEGCSVDTQRKIKTFYAFSQFMATMACSITWNPAWPLICLFPIQIASLLMTLVRKGLLSTKGYHLAYGLALCLPYFTILRSTIAARSWLVPVLSTLASAMFYMRRKGVSKYALWGIYGLIRVTIFDRIIDWRPWTF